MRQPRSLKWLAAIAIIVIIAYFVAPIRDSVAVTFGPAVRWSRSEGESIGGFFATIAEIPNLAKENGKLQTQVNELKAEQITNAELKHENDLLRQEVSLSNGSQSQNLIAAEVISRSTTLIDQSIYVNKGGNDGMIKGMAVVTQGYLIGTVTDITAHTSRITLIISSQSQVPVVMQNSRALAILQGGANGLTVNEVPRDVTIAKNEAVVTSNVGDIINAGIPVGNVDNVTSIQGQVFQSASIQTPVDFSRLEIVFGVKQ